MTRTVVEAVQAMPTPRAGRWDGREPVEGHVVICCDDPAGAPRAVRWAAEQCRLRNSHMRMVRRTAGIGLSPDHLFESSPAAPGKGIDGFHSGPGGLDGDRVRTRPWLAGADLVVLGTAGTSSYAHPPFGAFVRAAAGTCPVVVVPAAGPDVSLVGTGPVVAGIDASLDTPLDQDAILRAAFAEAALLSTNVLVVRAWGAIGMPQWSPTGPVPLSRADWLDASENHRRVLASTVAPWRTRYADVDVEQFAVYGSTSNAFLMASQGAQLLVVGDSAARAGDVAPEPTIGPLTRQLGCPLMIVADTALHHDAGTDAVLPATGRTPVQLPVD